MSAKAVVIGGGGSIGQELVGFLSRNEPELQILAVGRSLDKLSRMQDLYGGNVNIQILDCSDPSAVRNVLQGSDIVCNCAGPSAIMGGSIARESLRAGIPYADPSDSRSMQVVFENNEIGHITTPALFGAGVVPGLSGVVPLWFEQHINSDGGPWSKMDIYYVGKDEFSSAAAYDYAESVRMAALSETEPAKPYFIDVPVFGQTFFAFAHKSEEHSRINCQMHIPFSYHNCFIGEHMLRALGTIGGRQGAGLSLDDAAVILREASQACVNQYGKGHSFLCRAERSDGLVDSLTVFIEDVNVLMGTTMGLSAQALLRGKVSGAHYFAEALDAAEVISELKHYGCICVVGLDNSFYDQSQKKEL
ncbi:saccharopine dehydrogenase NADP-binding domain-containing protein [Desulfovibrio sp. UCD-KL4C]|uniref:saccharopine dehydrogenase NADP-binding domain-containing protein n=1 Tax=Desulfovibrio sp. UCD-KL4C TaxID=2578120 RepID=UPI0025BBF771|nr:saccharopine dehydrogenase NADP-binding domain-containing protein [Desulfovibrio sp. UCD-KL4C]